MGHYPRPHAIDLVGLYILAFGYWIQRTEAHKVAPNPTVEKSR
jgi:hypothetical protein